MPPRVLILPGYGDSGPEHWQTRWERLHGYRRVVQDDWESPRVQAWLARLSEAVRSADVPAVLVAHSLGCALVAHWARAHGGAGVVGALLVAPADVDEIAELLPEVESFAPVPAERLPFPSIVVASDDDAYMTPARARRFATAWGARLVEVGAKGHLNAESGLGDWPEGHRLLLDLLG